MEKPVEPTRPIISHPADSTAAAHAERRQVRVPALHAVAVSDPDEVPARRMPAREHDATRTGGSYACAVRRREVDARVETRSARSEAVGDGCVKGTRHVERRMPACGAGRERRRPCRPVAEETPTVESAGAQLGFAARDCHRSCRMESRATQGETAARRRPSLFSRGSARGCRWRGGRASRTRPESAVRPLRPRSGARDVASG